MNKKKQKWLELSGIALGNLILAFGTACFILPNDILSGGVAGVAIALYPMFHINEILVINLLNIALFGFGLAFLGKSFALKSLLSTILYPTFLNIINYIISFYDPHTFIMEPYLASIYGGIFTGIGLGLVFRQGASTGGMDIPSLILAKYTPIKEGDAVALVDGATVLIGIITYGLSAALIGLFSAATCSYAINKIMTLGMEPAKNLMVISDKYTEIKLFLMTGADRGVTMLEAKGAYLDKERPVVMCVITQRQLPMVQKEILNIDPKAFIIVNDVDSVHGSGFTYQDGALN